MSELSNEAITIYKNIQMRQKTEGMIAIGTVLVMELTQEQTQKSLIQLLRKGKLFSPMEGYVQTAEELDNSTESSVWMNPDSLKWSGPIMPVSYASKKKGPYWLNNAIADAVFKELRATLLKKIQEGGHSIQENGYSYWLDTAGRGIARRPHGMWNGTEFVKEIKQVNL
jgi:hypothetical protein